MKSDENEGHQVTLEQKSQPTFTPRSDTDLCSLQMFRPVSAFNISTYVERIIMLRLIGVYQKKTKKFWIGVGLSGSD